MQTGINIRIYVSACDMCVCVYVELMTVNVPVTSHVVPAGKNGNSFTMSPLAARRGTTEYKCAPEVEMEVEKGGKIRPRLPPPSFQYTNRLLATAAILFSQARRFD